LILRKIIEIVATRCHFKAMQQIRFRLGLCPGPRWRADSALPTPSWIEGSLLLREGREDEWGERATEGRGERRGDNMRS